MTRKASNTVSIPMAKPQCGTCRHYYDAAIRVCRRNPPAVFRTPSGVPLSFWPPVTKDDACGEWAQRNG